MKRLLTNTVLICVFSFNALAQNFEKPKIDDSNKLGSATKSQEFTLQCAGEINTISADLKWLPTLTNKCVGRNHSIPDQEAIEKMINEKTLLKQNQSANKAMNSENAITSVTPVIGTNFLGNVNNGMSPMDNSIAISDGGWIVSVANTTIEYDDITGANTYYNTIPAFYNDNTITNTCDPVVHYDSGADRFIFFAQECAGSSSNSYLLICFSKTNNPNDGWWKYKLTGNPLNNNKWFDYPKIAVSNNELYITGNLFSNNPGGTFDQAILYQIEKTNGYLGGSINWQYWSAIAGSPFTLLPVSNGQSGNYGPGCYIVATSSGGASAIKFYDLTNDMSASNEQLNYYSVPTTAYAPAGDAQQLGTSCLLDNGDCRTLSGFYLNGTVHFVFHSDVGSGWNGINYNRLNVSSKTNQSSTFGSAGNSDYSYPSVVSYATLPTDASVMIGFGRSSANMYPEVRAVNCDNGMNWSSSSLVKSSSNYVSYTSTTKERWGDYTGTARKHNSTNPSIWLNGMYATSSNLWNTWIAEIHDNQVGIKENIKKDNAVKVYPNPVVETFSVEFVLEKSSNLIIEVVDANGKTVKQLFNGKGVQGVNNFSFNKANLSSGTYFLVITNSSTIIKNEKIIITN
ncbi:MAG: T9SS type A sorting domain-containing protein [Bacteroidia bacterium]|nr:T9SS type A sorting domain-containing protein [Bacteroidia bacterium]